MAISIHTEIEKQGLIDPPLEGDSATMEWGYGLYVNAYVYDSLFAVPGISDGGLGIYATERIPFDHDQATLSRARKRARERARHRYLKARTGG